MTPLENVRRSDGNVSKTHCRNGHPFNEANTKWGVRRSGKAVGQRYRQCRVCQQAQAQVRLERRREARGYRPGFCRNGHDKAVVGLAKNGRWPACAECKRLSYERRKGVAA